MAVSDIGVFTPEEFGGVYIGDLPASVMGIMRMLQENAPQLRKVPKL